MNNPNVIKNIPTAIVLGVVSIVSSMCYGQSPGDQYAVASAHYAAERWKLAATEFQAFVDFFPNHAESNSAVFYLGESLIQIRQFREAAVAFEQLVVRHQFDPRVDRAIFRWGESSMLAGDDAAARRLLEQFHDRYPDHQLNEFALYYLGNLAAKQSDSRAIGYYADLLRSFPNTKNAAEAHLQLGIQHYRHDDLSDAMQQFGLVETNYPLTNDRSSIHLRARSRYWMGVTQLARKDYQHAATTLQSVETISPDHPLVAPANYFAGEAFLANGRHDQADRAFAKVTQHNEHSVWADDALFRRIRIAHGRSQHESVDQLAQEFVDKFGESTHFVDVLAAHSRSMIARREFQQAEPYLQNAIQIAAARSQQNNCSTSQSQLDSLRFMAGLCCLGQGQWQDALRLLEQIDLDSSESLRARTELAFGCAKLELGDYREATANLQSALSGLVDESMLDSCRAKLVRAYLAQEQNADAEQMFRSMERVQEDAHLESAQRIADKLFDEKEYARAVAYYEILQQSLQPDFAAAGHQGLAWCQKCLGNHRAAAIVFGKFIETFPSHEMVDQSTFMLAKCLESDGDLQSALTVHQRAGWRFNDELATEAAIAQARLLDSLGKKQAAIITLEEAIQDPTVDPSQLVRMTYQLGWRYLAAAQATDAERAFRTIHDQYPETPFWSDATFRLAMIESEQQKRPEALETLERLFACARDSEVHPQSLLLKAKLLAEDGRWHESLAVIEQLANQFCHLEISCEAEYWLAEANFRIDNFDAAERLFAGLAQRPDTALKPEWQALVPLRRAQLMAMKANWRAAADQASFVLNSFPNFRQAFEAEYLLGRCLAAQARFAEARKHYDNVVSSENARKTETAAMAQWMIGESYFHQKSYDEAIRAYLKVDILYDNRRWQAAALLQAAKCFELTNELHDAVNLYTRLMSDFSDTPFAAQAIARQNAIKANKANGNQTAATTNGSKLK